MNIQIKVEPTDQSFHAYIVLFRDHTVNLTELNIENTTICMIQMSDYAHFITHQNKYLESDLVNIGIRIIFSSTFDYDTCRGMVSTFKEYLDMYRNSSDIRDKQYGIYTG